MPTQRQVVDGAATCMEKAAASMKKDAAALRQAHEAAIGRIRGCLIQGAAAVAEDLREIAGEILAADAHGEPDPYGPGRRRALERGAAEKLIYLGRVGRDLANMCQDRIEATDA